MHFLTTSSHIYSKLFLMRSSLILRTWQSQQTLHWLKVVYKTVSALLCSFFTNTFENKTGALLVEGSVDFLLLYTWQSPRLVTVVLLTQARFTANFVVIVISLKLFRIRAVSLAKTPESLPVQKLTYCPFLL